MSIAPGLDIANKLQSALISKEAKTKGLVSVFTGLTERSDMQKVNTFSMIMCKSVSNFHLS